jgi:NAD(P)-dependent dehydrogenase (short-subunit alcohol dehydrogenase family)
MSPASVFAAGRTALITGGSNGVGFAVAQLAHKHKMKVSIIDNNAEYIKHAKEKLPEAQYYQMDVSKLSDWQDLKSKVEVPDFLMLNAGIGARGTWGDADYFNKIFDVNLFGVVCIQQFEPLQS